MPEKVVNQINVLVQDINLLWGATLGRHSAGLTRSELIHNSSARHPVQTHMSIWAFISVSSPASSVGCHIGWSKNLPVTAHGKNTLSKTRLWSRYTKKPKNNEIKWLKCNNQNSQEKAPKHFDSFSPRTWELHAAPWLRCPGCEVMDVGLRTKWGIFVSVGVRPRRRRAWGNMDSSVTSGHEPGHGTSGILYTWFNMMMAVSM